MRNVPSVAEIGGEFEPVDGLHERRSDDDEKSDPSDQPRGPHRDAHAREIVDQTRAMAELIEAEPC